jgi:hypothetical protein
MAYLRSIVPIFDAADGSDRSPGENRRRDLAAARESVSVDERPPEPIHARLRRRQRDSLFARLERAWREAAAAADSHD